MRRNKSNLLPPEPPKPPKLHISTAQERRYFLMILGLFRVFDVYYNHFTEPS